MQDEDTLAELRDQVRRAQDNYETLVRLQEQYPEREWIDSALDRAVAAVSSAKEALKVAMEPAPAVTAGPVVTEQAPPARPPTKASVDPSTLRWAPQARFHDCAQFRDELGDALIRIRDDEEGAFTRQTIAAAIGKCSADTLDNYRRMCQVDLTAEIARAQRSKRTSERI